MGKKWGIAVHMPDGQMGYLTDNIKPALFDTKEAATKELKRRMKNKAYTWSVPVTVEPYVNHREKGDVKDGQV